MSTDETLPGGIRLQKLMAAAGVASRRVSEDLITAGRVEVNGEIVTELGRRVSETDRIAVDGVAIQLDTSRRYLMLNKPVGIVSSLRDDRGRPDLSRYVSRYEERLFNVGRLDAQTSGLLILTNDGELAHVLAHPSFGVMKTYIAKVEGKVTAQTIAKLTAGVELEDGPIAADKARILGSGAGHSESSEGGRGSGSGSRSGSRSGSDSGSRGGSTRNASETIVEVTLHSGRNRIVRRMLDEVGHPVIDLVRRQFGPLHLGTLALGEIRDLTKVELGQLLTISRNATGGAAVDGHAPGDHAPGDHAPGDHAPDGHRADGHASGGIEDGASGQLNSNDGHHE